MLVLGLGALGLLSTGCTSNRAYAYRAHLMKEDIAQGDIDKARVQCNQLYKSCLAGECSEPGGKPASDNSVDGGKSLCWAMERGLIEHLGGELPKSDDFLQEAGKMVDELRTKSISKEGLSWLANDNVKDYVGSSFEHLQVDYYMALNQLTIAQDAQGQWVRPTKEEPGLPGAKTPVVAPDPAPDLSMVWQQANSRVRRMTEDSLKRNSTLQDTALRYVDDPWVRAFAAAVTMATPPNRQATDDRNFANSQLQQAVKVYVQQAKTLGTDKLLRYETPKLPLTVAKLFYRIGSDYDLSETERILKEQGFASKDPRLADAAPKKGQGQVLVLNHVNFIAPTQALTFSMGTGAGALFTAVGAPLSEEEQKLGYSSYAWAAWKTIVNIKGPNAEGVKDWGAGITIAGDIASGIAQIRGADPTMIIEFQIPGHPKDVPIASTAKVSAGNVTAIMEVVQDLDCHARASLKDLQPGVLLKTLSRTVGKQVVVAIGAQAAENKGGWLAGFLTRLFGGMAVSSTESADIRNWKSLPDHVEAALITLPVGKHPIVLDGPAGKTDLGTVNVGDGRLVIVHARTFEGPCAPKKK